jgi:HlyD family secretion protein
MKKWVLVTAVIIALGIIGGAAYMGYQNINAQTATIANETPPSVPASRGDVQKTVIAPGKVVNTGTTVIAPTLSSYINEIDVRPGDYVQKGDVLARLDDSAARRAVTEAELAVTQAALNTDVDAVDRAIAQAQIDVSQAELNAAAAQAKLDELLNWEADPDEIVLAEAELAAAEGRYNAALSSDSATSYSAGGAQVRLEQAQRALAQAQTEYDNAHDPARDWEFAIDDIRKAHTANLQITQDALSIAQAEYNAAQARINYGGSNAAQSEIVRAQQALASAESGPTDAEITLARVEAQQRELDLQRVQLQLEAAQNNEQAELALVQAQLNLEKAQTDLAATTIIAPMDGVVLAVTANVGDAVSPGMGLIRLADQSAHEIQVSVIEEDLPLVQEGQPVDIYFDAQPEAEVQGTVARIVPKRVQGSDRPLYHVYIAIPELPKGVVADMTVDTSIILDQRTEVLRLPRSLLSTRSDGTAVVKVWKNNNIEERSVEVGVRGDTYIDILNGIHDVEEHEGQ